MLTHVLSHSLKHKASQYTNRKRESPHTVVRQINKQHVKLEESLFEVHGTMCDIETG